MTPAQRKAFEEFNRGNHAYVIIADLQLFKLITKQQYVDDPRPALAKCRLLGLDIKGEL